MPSLYGIGPYGAHLYGTDGTYTVFVAGVPQFVEAGTLSINSTIGKRSTASFTVKTDNNTHFQQYQQVSIYDGMNTLIFSGYISQPKETKPGFQPVLEHQITCTDQHFLADKRIIAATYTNTTVGTIVQSIVTNILSQEGVTVGQIVDDATGTDLFPSISLYPSTTLYPQLNASVIPSAIFAYSTVAQALDELVKVASIAGVPYYWQIDQFKQLWFVPYTSVVNSTVVDGTQIDDGTRTGSPPSVIRANPAYGNTQYIIGGVTQTVTQTEIQVGDGNKQSFTMGYELASAPVVSINTGSGYITQSVGLKGTSGSQWYWAQGDNTITQDSAGTKLRGSPSNDLLKVVYVGQYPSVASDQNVAQISYEAMLDGSTGIVERVDTDNTITSLSSGLAEASQFLTRYAQQGTQLTFRTRQTGFAQGQLVTVNLPDYMLYNAQMLLENVSAVDTVDSYNIWYEVTAVLGPYDVTWVDFFSKLLPQQAPANNINIGSGKSVAILASFTGSVTPSATLNVNVYSCPLPGTTQFPQTTLYPC